MKYLIVWTTWLIITSIWAYLKDENKNEIIFRFIFTGIFVMIISVVMDY